MLKANAYGFGAIEVASAIKDLIDLFGVCTLDEALAIKNANIDKDILLLLADEEDLQVAISNGFILSIYNRQLLDKLIYLAKNNLVDKERLRIHLKVDSGMHRLGFKDDIEYAVDCLKENDIQVEGVFSHLRDDTLSQKQEFDRLSSIVLDKYPEAIKHIVSSHSLQHKCMHYDLVRVGLYAYQGAMSIVSRVVDLHSAKAGEFVGYGNQFVDKDTHLATVFGGYQEGLDNTKRVWINNRECRVVGDVCMDSFIVDIGDGNVQIGDRVVIVDSNHIDDIIDDRNTKEYNIYTSVKGRVNRQYYDKKRGENTCN